MTKIRLSISLLLGATAFVVASSLDLGPRPILEHGLTIPSAHAIVGRPGTAVSVAGVARRTTRRVMRRTAYYYAVLPPGCIYPSPYGPYYQCGSTYYEQVGTQYVVVVLD
jgi:hypothetical protein